MAMLLHLLVASLAFIFSVDGHMIKCSAPTAVRGQPATVTCHFGRDIQKERRDFKIHKYDREGKFQGVVLNCLWNGHTRPYCETKPGYFFNERVNDSATLQIQNATEDNVGTYVCQLTPVVQEDVLEDCFLAVKEPSEPVVTTSTKHHHYDKEDGSNPLLPALVTVVVLSVGVIVTLVVALVITRRSLLELKRRTNADGEGLPLLGRADSVARPSVIKEISRSGRKALLLSACRANQVQMAMWLIESGASVNGRDKVNGDAPLHVACRCGHERILQILLYFRADIEAKNDKGYTPLHKACKYGRTTIVKMLVDAGADINAIGHKYITPLQLALDNDFTDIIVVLRNAGAIPSDNDIKKLTP